MKNRLFPNLKLKICSCRDWDVFTKWCQYGRNTTGRQRARQHRIQDPDGLCTAAVVCQQIQETSEKREKCTKIIILNQEWIRDSSSRGKRWFKSNIGIPEWHEKAAQQKEKKTKTFIKILPTLLLQQSRAGKAPKNFCSWRSHFWYMHWEPFSKELSSSDKYVLVPSFTVCS